MSSNMYGFTCAFTWEGRNYEAQIVYVGTSEDDPSSPDRITNTWESCDPRDLAQYELDCRDWSKTWHEVRIAVWRIWGGWREGDPEDPSWSPPNPSEREALAIIAQGGAKDFVVGWDT